MPVRFKPKKTCARLRRRWAKLHNAMGRCLRQHGTLRMGPCARLNEQYETAVRAWRSRGCHPGDRPEWH